MSENVDIKPEEYVGYFVVGKKRIGTKKYGQITEVLDTPFGKVLMSTINEREFYLPVQFIDHVGGKTIYVKNKLRPYSDRFWENLTERIPVIQNVPIGKIQEVQFRDGKAYIVIKPKLALPKIIEEVWRKVKSKPKESYYDYVKKTFGLPPELALYPKVVALMAKTNDIEVPDDLFMDYFVTPLPPLERIDDFYIHLDKYPEVIEYETYTVDDLSILPKPLRYQIPQDVPLDKLLTELQTRIRDVGLKTKLKNNNIYVTPQDWLLVSITPKENELEMALEVDWRKYIQSMEPPMPWYVLLFGIFGVVIWANQIRRLRDKRLIGQTFIDDPLNFEAVKKIREAIEETLGST